MKVDSVIRVYILAVAICCLALLNTANAAEAKVELEVSNMTCAACPYIVKKSLVKVDGVKDASVSYKRRVATVTYDDQITSASSLMEATAGVGFPSKLVK